MCKAEAKMGSKPLEWYAKQYMKVFPRNKDPLEAAEKPVCRVSGRIPQEKHRGRSILFLDTQARILFGNCYAFR